MRPEIVEYVATNINGGLVLVVMNGDMEIPQRIRKVLQC